MLITFKEIALLMKILPPKIQEGFPLLELAMKKGIKAMEMSGRVVAKLLEIIDVLPMGILPPEVHSDFTDLVYRLREELCRLKKTGTEEPKNPALLGIEKALEGKSFSSQEEAQKFIDSWQSSINDQPQPDLGNLTPNQLENLFRNGWWNSNGPIKLSQDFSVKETSSLPIVRNVRLLISTLQKLASKGRLKATVTGRIPRALISEILPRLVDPENIDRFCSGRKKQANESDLPSFSWQVDLARFSGLINLRRGYWSVTQLGEKLLVESESQTLLRCLFGKAFHGYDLSFRDGYQRFPDFEFLLPFSLWKLSTLPPDRDYEVTELASEILHPKLLEMRKRPLFEGSKLRVADFLAESRLFSPLVVFGFLTASGLREFSKPLIFRVTNLFKKFYSAPGLQIKTSEIRNFHESDSGNQEARSTIIKNSSDIGRNNPCPCGSGKKFKKCCQEKLSH